MKLLGIAAAVMLTATATHANTNEQIIKDMSELDRMVACSMAHESWQYNAPNEQQADSHRIKSTVVMDQAVKKYGSKAYLKMGTPLSMTFKMVALNRASLSLEKRLCSGFGEQSEFTVADNAPQPQTEKKSDTLSQKQQQVRDAIKGFKDPADFYQLLDTGNLPGEYIRAYMCFNAFAVDFQGERYERYVNKLIGVKELETALEGNAPFAKFYEHAFGQYMGQFVDGYCKDSNNTLEDIKQIASRYSGMDFIRVVDRSDMPVTVNLLCSAALNDEYFTDKAYASYMGELSDSDVEYFLQSSGVQEFVGSLKSEGTVKSFTNIYCKKD